MDKNMSNRELAEAIDNAASRVAASDWSQERFAELSALLDEWENRGLADGFEILEDGEIVATLKPKEAWLEAYAEDIARDAEEAAANSGADWKWADNIFNESAIAETFEVDDCEYNPTLDEYYYFDEAGNYVVIDSSGAARWSDNRPV